MSLGAQAAAVSAKTAIRPILVRMAWAGMRSRLRKLLSNALTPLIPAQAGDPDSLGGGKALGIGKWITCPRIPVSVLPPSECPRCRFEGPAGPRKSAGAQGIDYDASRAPIDPDLWLVDEIERKLGGDFGVRDDNVS